MSKYKAIIFDLDGTLADTLDDLTIAMNKMLVSFGWPTKTRDELIKNINRGGRKFVSQSMPQNVFKSDDDKIVDLALSIYSKKYAEAYCVKTKAFEGLEAQIKILKEKGYKLGVLSNKSDAFVKNIISTLYPNLFDVVIGESNMPTKPAPMAAWKIAGDFGLVSSDCILVGDSDIDMETAKNAGMYPVGVKWGYRDESLLKESGAKAIVSSTTSLVETIEGLNKQGFFAKLFKK